MKFIYVEWADAVYNNAAWVDREVAEHWANATEYIVKGAGFIIKETDTMLCIASEYKPEDEFLEEQFKGLMYIPKPWIIKRIDLTNYIETKK